jgi:hypothetical protein
MLPFQLMMIIRGRCLRQPLGVRQKLLIDLNRRGTGENHRTLDHVLEFADMARPVIAGKSVQRVRNEVGARPLEFQPKLFRKMTGQGRKALRSVPEGREHDQEHMQAITQVEPESAGADDRNDASTHWNRLRASLPIDLPLFQDPSEIRLGLQRYLADLVQKERPAGRPCEPSESLHVRLDERATLVTKKLAFDQPYRQCCTTPNRRLDQCYSNVFCLLI